MRFESETDSLKRRLTEAEENLRLIAERKSEYVQETDIPLQLIKDERRLREEIEELQSQLADLPPPEEASAPRLRVRIAAGAAVLILLGAVSAFVFGLFPTLFPSLAPSPASDIALKQLGETLYPDCNVRAVVPAQEGVLVALDSCAEQGVRRVGGSGQGLNPGNPEGLLVAPFESMEDSSGRLWVGTAFNGLVDLSPAGVVTAIYTQTADGSSIEVVRAIALHNEGGVWVGAGMEPGLHWLDQDGRWSSIPWEGARFAVDDIALDEDGRVWLATFGGGVRCWDPSASVWAVYNQHERPGCLPSDNVFAVHIEQGGEGEGRKWVGTDKGVAVLDDRAGQLKCQTVPNALLPHSQTVALAGDGEGHIFIGAEKGLEEGSVTVLDAALNAVDVLTFEHGVISLAFDPAQSQLWVGTYSGVSVWSVES